MTPPLSDLTAALLQAAKSAGADAADAVAAEGTSISVGVREGALEEAERSEGVEIGLRVLVGQRQAIVSASDIKPSTMTEMAERAVAMAKEAPEDPYIGLADADQLSEVRDGSALDLFDPSPEPGAAELEDMARRAEAAAIAVDGVTQVQSAGAGYSRRVIQLATSNGFSGGYTRGSTGLSAVAITGEGTGMERDYFGESRTYANELPSPEDVGRIAGERTVARLGAKKPPTGAFPVLYDERVASTLIGHITQAINGASVARGSSWLRDSMGDMILPKDMSLIEDPHRARIGGSRPFDGEGLRTNRRVIVEDGRLMGWTLDLGTARQLGLQSTGNAARGVSAPPSPSTGNLELQANAETRESLLKDMGTGLLITSLIGSTVNPTTGDYSRGASGFWVENGEITYPVNECTVAGNLLDMLKTLRAADDARPWVSRVVPSLLVEGLTLAGD